MSERDDGGPAFPVTETGTGITLLGMSLRDYMAIHAPAREIDNIIPGDIGAAARWIGISVENYSLGKGYLLCITKARYIWADAMLKEREK